MNFSYGELNYRLVCTSDSAHNPSRSLGNETSMAYIVTLVGFLVRSLLSAFMISRLNFKCD